MNKKDISLQVYTTRNFKPFTDVLNFISHSGITNIELFGLETINLNNFKKYINNYKLTCKSSHVSFESLIDTSDIIKRAKSLGIQNIIVPAPPKKGNNFEDQFSLDEEEWVSFGKQLSSYISPFEDSGLTLGYHNHSFEFKPLPSGKLPIQCIMEYNDKLKFEIDLGWTIAGGANPITWIDQYSDKIIACHLKDFFDENKDMLNHANQSAVGDGFINWRELLNSIRKTNCKLFILEHDDPVDYKNYILKSIKNLEEL